MRANETIKVSPTYGVEVGWEDSGVLPPLEIMKEDYKYGRDSYIFLTRQEAEKLRDFLNKCLDKPQP